jgi:CheY-like chemotaxis protein
VFVLEDEPIIAMMVVQMLDVLGCDFIGPVSGLREGLHRAQTETFDAAILNLVIEGKKAYDVAEILARRGIPFGFASGAEHDPIAKEWFDRPFLTKPYSTQQLAHLLAQVLAKSFDPLPTKIISEIAQSQIPAQSLLSQRRSSEPPAPETADTHPQLPTLHGALDQ